MALASKAGAKKKAAGGGMRAASMDPESMFQGGGGLPNLFRGIVEQVRTFVWAAKEGSGFGDRTAVKVLIRPVDADDQPDDAILPQKHLDEHDGLVEARYGLGKTAEWLPSLDGDEPVDIDADEEGIYAVPTEELIEKFQRAGNEGMPQLNRGTNWAFFLQKLIDLGYKRDQILPNVDSLEGIEAVFCRVPQPERGGGQASATGDGGQRRDNTILVATELISVPYKAAAGKGAGKTAAAGKTATKPAASAKGKAAAKAESNGGGDLDAKMYAAIEEALNDADDGTLTLNAAKKVAVKALDSDEKKDGLARLGDEEFWADWENGSLDDETGEVSLIG